MDNRICIVDYGCEWALKERYQYQIPRSTSGYLTLEEVVAFYGTLGVDGIELMHFYWHDYSAAQLRKFTTSHGLPIIVYCFEANLTLPAAERHLSVEEASRLLERTAELGASRAMILPGGVKPNIPLAEQRAWLVDGLRACAEKAASLGVTLLAENTDDAPMRPLMGHGADCRDICAEVDSPAFRLIYDSAGAICSDENSLDTLAAMAPYVAHAHLKNVRPVAAGEKVERSTLVAADGRHFLGTVLDGGVVNLPQILAALEKIGYDGYFNIEYQGEDDPRVALRHNVDYLRRIGGEPTAKV